MILVTLGTQDKTFRRLLEAVQKQIDNKVIKEKVVAQVGNTKFESKDIDMYDLISIDKFDKLMQEADILITHAGVGSIVTGLKKGKVVIAAARLKKYGEHENDHQVQILDELEKRGNIIALRDFDKLDEALEKAKTFKPNSFKSNTPNMIKLIENYIDNN